MFNKETYISRRASLAANVKSGVLLFLGNAGAPYNSKDNQYQFRQDSTFLYYFGLDSADLAAVIDLDNGRQIVFGDDVDINDIIWTGPVPSIAEQAAEIGIAETYPLDKLADFLKEAASKGRKVHYLPPYRNHNKIMLHSILGLGFDEMKEKASVEFIKAVVAQRIVKEPCEIVEIDKACDAGYIMHFTAMKMMKLGMVEQDLVGIMEGVARKYFGVSFPIILTQHGEIFHNHGYNGILTDGRICVVDAGVEIASHYCSDHTRTLPSSGRFTQQQKDIYSIVSACQDLAIELARPGITYKEVHLAVSRLMLQGLKNVGLVKGDIDEACSEGVQGLFMPHGLGHNMGLDDHDMEDLGENYVGYDEKIVRSTQFGLSSLRMGKELRPGHVITDEPGIYFIPELIDKWKAEGKCADFINYSELDRYRTFGGVRIEDDLLITENGCRLLGRKRLPHTVEEVEKEMQQ